MKITCPIFVPAVALAALLLASPSTPAASILLSSGDFTLLGGTFITSTGVSGTEINNGNVGLSPGPTTGISGFPPAVIVNGAIIATGPVTAQARLDLMKAQVGLAGMASDKNLSNVNLAGKTLRSGVYTFNETASLDGTLFLDGEGQNNAFWVFQIGTGLTTSANASVIIINSGSNGGRDYGIFWNAGSAITIGANNAIAGNYLAGTSITFGATSHSGGRALALAGITLDNNQLDAKGGPGGSDWSGGLQYDFTGAVIPVEKLAFRHYGSNRRTTYTINRIIRGNATVTATTLQWRTNARKWHNVSILSKGAWTAIATNFQLGKNVVSLRVRDGHGTTTAIQKVTVWRR